MNILSEKWCGRFLHLAKVIASWSKDESTKVGAVIVNRDGHIKSTGFNGIPKNVGEHSYRQERPRKYDFYEHAERNAIYLSHSDIRNHIMFITAFPCPDCARGIVQTGISTVVIDKNFNNNPTENTTTDPINFPDKYNASRDILSEGGVKIIEHFGIKEKE